MSLISEVGKVLGTAALSTLGPVGVALAPVLNRFLSDDDKVTDKTPIEDVSKKMDALPAAQRAEVMQVFYDNQSKMALSNNETRVKVINTMEETDRLGKSGRPRIAMLMTYLLITITVVFAGGIAAISVINKTLPGWEVVAALLSLPTWVIQRHFHAEVQSDSVSASRAAGRQIDLPMGSFGRVATSFLDRKKGQ